MKKQILLTTCLSVAAILSAAAQTIKLTDARFHKGDNMEWKNSSFDDSSWQSLSMLRPWNEQGTQNPNNYAWYRIRFTLPQSMLDNSDAKESVVFDMGKIDDADETYPPLSAGERAHLLGAGKEQSHKMGRRERARRESVQR